MPLLSLRQQNTSPSNRYGATGAGSGFDIREPPLLQSDEFNDPGRDDLAALREVGRSRALLGERVAALTGMLPSYQCPWPLRLPAVRYPFRSPNLRYGPARSGEGLYCVTALKGKEAGSKLEG